MFFTPCPQNRILLAGYREFFFIIPFLFSTIKSVNSDRPMSSGYAHAAAHQNILNVIPESSYPSHPRYDHPYAHNGHSSRHAGYRHLNHEPVSWNTPSEYVNVIFVICITLTFVLNLVRNTGPNFGSFAPHVDRTPHEISIKSLLAQRHITTLFHHTPSDYPRMCTLSI